MNNSKYQPPKTYSQVNKRKHTFQFNGIVHETATQNDVFRVMWIRYVECGYIQWWYKLESCWSYWDIIKTYITSHWTSISNHPSIVICLESRLRSSVRVSTPLLLSGHLLGQPFTVLHLFWLDFKFIGWIILAAWATWLRTGLIDFGRCTICFSSVFILVGSIL